MLTTLRFERLKRGLPLWKMAQMLGVSPATMSKIEMARIKPSKELLDKIGLILSIDRESETLLEIFN